MTPLKNKFAYQLMTAASQILLPLIIYPYVTRTLGPGSLGKVNNVDFIAQVFILLAIFGVPVYGAREIAVNRDDVQKRSGILSEMILIQLVFAAGAVTAYTLTTFNNWGGEKSLYLLGMLNILLYSFSFDWYMQGMEHFRYTSLSNWGISILKLAAFFLCIRHPKDSTVFYLIFTAGTLALVILNWIKIIRENNFIFTNSRLRLHLKPMWHFFLASTAISIYVYFDTILLKYITHNDEAVGHYTTSLKIVKVFLAAIIAVGTVLMPRLSYLVGMKRSGEIKAYLDKSIQFNIVSALPITGGLFLLAPEIIAVMAGDKFLPAVPIMRILSLLPLLIAFSNTFCFQVLVPFRREKKILVAVMAGCVTSIALNCLLIPVFFAAGAACAAAATELTVTLVSGILAFSLVKFSFHTKILMQTALAVLLFLPIIYCCRQFAASPLITLLISIPVCMATYTGCQYLLFKNEIITAVLKYMVHIKKSFF